MFDARRRNRNKHDVIRQSLRSSVVHSKIHTFHSKRSRIERTILIFITIYLTHITEIFSPMPRIKIVMKYIRHNLALVPVFFVFTCAHQELSEQEALQLKQAVTEYREQKFDQAGGMFRHCNLNI